MRFFNLLIMTLFFFTNSQGYIPIFDIIGNISTFNIPVLEDGYYDTVIDSLIDIMDNYAYINLLKSPPKVNGSDYFAKVDIIQDLKDLKSRINGTTPNFYEFYQDLSKIIASTQDYHIIFSYIGRAEPYSLLSKIIISSPIDFDFQKDKKVLVNLNSVISALSKEATIQNSEIISNYYKNKISVEKINGKNIYDFIRDFCSDYCRFKSKSSKFMFNKLNIRAFSLGQCPLALDEFKSINITYSNGETISSNYIGFIPKTNQLEVQKNNFLLENFNNLKNKYISENLISEKNENNLEWDINIDNHIKCKVDHKNEVNVIFQNSFSPNNSNPEGIINNISYCHGNFTNNDYPVIVIESLNGGGYAQLSKLMQQMVQDLMQPKNYFSVIHNNNTKKFLYDNKDSFLFVDDDETRNLTIEEYYNDTIYEKYGDITIERSKQRLLVDLNFESLIKTNIFKRNKIKKPTNIIIFTDSMSFSATSVFTKSLYYFGGAILVGYSGDPELDSFDASQNPTFILTNLTGIKGFNKLIQKGFYFPRMPSGSMYRSSYDKNNENIPEEFTVNLIDERVNIYNNYKDDLYEDFITEAKNIFKKYESQCNPNNKYLNFLKEDCTFNDIHLHGGYKCGSNGKWNETCVPFYCDEHYYFEPNSQKCILLKEKDNEKENKEEDNNSVYIIIFSILGVLIIIVIVLFILHKSGKINLMICCNKKEIDYKEMKDELVKN